MATAYFLIERVGDFESAAERISLLLLIPHRRLWAFLFLAYDDDTNSYGFFLSFSRREVNMLFLERSREIGKSADRALLLHICF